MQKRFNIMGTIAADILRSDNNLRTVMGRIDDSVSFSCADRTTKEWITSIFECCFSIRRGTESMERGTRTEKYILSSLKGMEFIAYIHDVGLMMLKEEPSI